MEFVRNVKGPCGKRAKWSLGEMGKLGEMASGRNEKCAKMKLGETQKSGQILGGKGKGRSWKRRKKEWAKWEKFGRIWNRRNGIGQTGNKPLIICPC